LADYGLSVYPDTDDPAMTVVSDLKDITMSLRFPDEISNGMLQQLTRKYGVPIHYFYNPNMIPKSKP